MAKKEILYRAKSKAKGEWLYGHVFEEFFYRFKEGWVKEWVLQPIREKVTDAGCRQIVDANTICDYTGLKDKNGTKVFEGDLIEFSHPSFKKSVICEVIYTEKEARFDLLCLFNPDFVVYCEDCKFGEVIGNKFDNPELLEGKL